MIKTFERIYNSGASRKYMEWATKVKEPIKTDVPKAVPEYSYKNYNKLKKNFPLFLMTWIPLVQCGFFATSKKMPEDKKYSLIFNEIYTAVVGIAITLLFRKHIDKLTGKFVEQAKKVYAKKSQVDKELLNEGITTAVPAAFTIVFCQYLAPVLTTPLATKTSQYFMKKRQAKNEQKPLDVKG